jgi:hypothetical protein
MANAATVTLHSDEWTAREVAQFALYATRRPGGIATLVGDLQARSYHPWLRNGERDWNARIWVIEDAQGKVQAEETSLYKAIHSIAK